MEFGKSRFKKLQNQEDSRRFKKPQIQEDLRFTKIQAKLQLEVTEYKEKVKLITLTQPIGPYKK